jgi:excisionase family DNA binding protein
MSECRPKRGKGKLVHQLQSRSPTVTAAEVAALVKAHVRTINRLVEAETIPRSRVGGSVRFDREAIGALLKDPVVGHQSEGLCVSSSNGPCT